MTVTINGTTGIAGTNGSAGTPAVQGEDTNTGIFFPAADTVGVATAGTERLRVDSSGNVGVGTTSIPSGRRLAVSGGSVRLDSDYQIEWGGSTAGLYGNGANNTLHFFTNTTERARIDASGNLLVGTTTTPSSSSSGCSIEDGAMRTSFGAYTGSGVHIYFINGNGTVGSITSNGSATSYVTSSDYRLKENVAPMQNALNTVAQLNPVTYTWKADGSAGQGFIAHELQAVVPDCVTGEKDAVDAEGNPQYQGVDTSFLVATLVKAVQELTARIAALEAAQ